MENLKHTKGEWSIHTSEQTKYLYSMIYSNDVRIAEVKSYGNCDTFNDATFEERLANEKLIAAAPELLEALILVKTVCEVEEKNKIFGDNDNHWTSKVLNAINKATNQLPQ